MPDHPSEPDPARRQFASHAAELHWMLRLDQALMLLLFVNSNLHFIRRVELVMYILIMGFVLSGWGLYRANNLLSATDDKPLPVKQCLYGFFWLLFLYVLVVPCAVR